jgi:uncharacterized protein (TIGR04255 family)
MAETYPQAPVLEAVIEFRTVPVSLDRVKKAAKRITKNYAIEEALWEIKVAGIAGAAAQPRTTQSQLGIQGTSQDASDIVMIKVGGLTVCRKTPYLGWDGFIGRMERDWPLYVRDANPRNIERLGVRFINRLDVPVEEGEIRLDDYVRVTPGIPIPMASEVLDSNLVIVAGLPESDLRIRIQVGGVESPLIGHKSFLLDLDVYRDHDVPQEGEPLWGLLAQMRDVKNSVFESLVTDKARALFR